MNSAHSARSFRLGVAQVDCVLGEVEANLENCLALVDEAESDGADLVVFPELALVGLTVEQVAYEAAMPVTSPVLDRVRARSETISIALGFLEAQRPGELYNAVGYFEQGQLAHVHRKLYLTTYGSLNEGKVLTPGDCYGTFQSRFGPMAIAICEDAWHLPVPYLAAMGGAQLLLTCAASPRGNTSASCSSEVLWRTVNRAHAVTLKMINVFSNRVGREQSLEFWGGSHVVAADGRLLLEIDDDRQGVALVDLDISEIGRQRYRFPYLRNERLDLTKRELDELAKARWGDPAATRYRGLLRQEEA